MEFGGILKEEDIAAAVQACLGFLKDIISIQTYITYIEQPTYR